MRKVFSVCCTKPTFDTLTHTHTQIDTIVKTSNNEICHCKSVHIYYFTLKDIYLYLSEWTSVLPWDKRWTVYSFWNTLRSTIKLQFHTIQILSAWFTTHKYFRFYTHCKGWKKSHRLYSSFFPNLFIIKLFGNSEITSLLRSIKFRNAQFPYFWNDRYGEIN